MIDETGLKIIGRRGLTAPFSCLSQKYRLFQHVPRKSHSENRFALFGMRSGANRLFLDDGPLLSSANQR
ncbi:MAG: hypothetical protein EAS49_02310 [Brucella intermedia]|nr:MAG: hypothetical protein EAS49_02310 [Brucella intermedia]